MVSTNRWDIAQDYERSYWQKQAGKIAEGTAEQLSWYSWKASEMEKRLGNLIRSDQKRSCRILEVGSGPVGIVSFLTWGDRYTIDPLEGFYRVDPVLTACRDPLVHYGEGTGERQPFEDEFFHLVILDNVLDHVQSPGSVLKEVHRVLSKKGLLYFAMNVHTAWGAFLHSILSGLRIDKGHPYSFSAKGIREFLRQHGFAIQSESLNDYFEARKQDRNSSSAKGRIKGYTGLSEFIFYAVCSKKV